MGTKKKIAIVTGSRAEYGLLYPLAKLIQNDKDCILQLVVTGAHMSPEFGLMHEQIRQDDFDTYEKIEILLSSSTNVGMAKSIGVGVNSFADLFSRIEPDVIVILGDRFEIFAVAQVAFMLRIPLVHIHGGELTGGALDDGLRHCITKLATLHLVSHQTYRERVIQLGEHPDTIHIVGSPGVETANKFHPIKKISLERELKIKFNKKTVIVTFNPETLSTDSTVEHFSNLLRALEPEGFNIMFAYANADAKGVMINNLIDGYIDKHRNCIANYHLSHIKFLSCLKYVKAIIGNSSSGIIEAPTLKTATINIGDRQLGRELSDSIINCDNSIASIKHALKTIYTKKHERLVSSVKNIIQGDDMYFKSLELIKNTDYVVNKKFYDMEIKND